STSLPVSLLEKVSAAADNEELNVEERNLLSIAYKNVIGARRASWRIISSIEQKEESRDNEDHVTVIRDYRSKIESELSNTCDDILKLLNSRLIPSASSGDSKVFYLKMKADYHRFQNQVSNIRFNLFFPFHFFFFYSFLDSDLFNLCLWLVIFRIRE
ncbi:hypothetical protein VIGAN_03134000, partial [Vigna angularis var. angularis]